MANLHVSISTWQQNVTAIMQPFHWDLQPHIELRTHEQPVVAEHGGGTDWTTKRLQSQLPHTWRIFIANHPRRKKHKVLCSGFLPNTSPFIAVYCDMWCKVSHFSLQCIVMWCKVSHHPSLQYLQYYCNVLRCNVLSSDVKYHNPTVRNSEDCFPTSLKNYGYFVSCPKNNGSRKF